MDLFNNITPAGIGNIETNLGFMASMNPPSIPICRDCNDLQISLSTIDDCFREMDSTWTSFSRADLHQRTTMLIDLVTGLISQAMENGWTVSRIRESLPNTWRISGSSELGAHIQNWPRGYQGDFEIINMIVDRAKPEISGFGDIIAHFALNCPITQQHREKLAIQAEMIRQTCRRQYGAKIMSVACGPCRDIETVQMEVMTRGARITLVDFDRDAIVEARKRLAGIEANIKTEVVDVRKFLGVFDQKNTEKYDLIYAGGLFDYLPDAIIRRIIRRASQALGEDGIFMFTNIACGNPYRPWIEVMGNWTLIERSEEQMLGLLQETGFSTLTLKKDPTGLTWISLAENKR